MPLFINNKFDRTHLDLLQTYLTLLPPTVEEHYTNQIQCLLAAHSKSYYFAEQTYSQHYVTGVTAVENRLYAMGLTSDEAVLILTNAIHNNNQSIKKLITQEITQRFTAAQVLKNDAWHQIQQIARTPTRHHEISTARTNYFNNDEVFIRYIKQCLKGQKPKLCFIKKSTQNTTTEQPLIGLIAALAELKAFNLRIHEAMPETLDAVFFTAHNPEYSPLNVVITTDAHIDLLLSDNESIHREQARMQAEFFAYTDILGGNRRKAKVLLQALQYHHNIPLSTYDNYLKTGQLADGLQKESFQYRLIFAYLQQIQMLQRDQQTHRTFNHHLEKYSLVLGLAKLILVYQNQIKNEHLAAFLERHLNELIKFKCSQKQGATPQEQTESKRLKHYALMYLAELAIQYPAPEKPLLQAWKRLSQNPTNLNHYTKTAYLTLLRLLLSMSTADIQSHFPDNAQLVATIRGYLNLLNTASKTSKTNTHSSQPKDISNAINVRRHRCHPPYVYEHINLPALNRLENVLRGEPENRFANLIDVIHQVPVTSVPATRRAYQGLSINPAMQGNLLLYLNSEHSLPPLNETAPNEDVITPLERVNFLPQLPPANSDMNLSSDESIAMECANETETTALILPPDIGEKTPISRQRQHAILQNLRALIYPLLFGDSSKIHILRLTTLLNKDETQQTLYDLNQGRTILLDMLLFVINKVQQNSLVHSKIETNFITLLTVITASLKRHILAQLLTASNRSGFTPLHRVLISGSLSIVKAYLKQVVKAELPHDKLVWLLTTPTKDRFTPLHDALKSDNPDIVNIYLEQVLRAKLPSNKLILLLTTSNKDGFTPLHEVLNSRNPDIIKAYLKQVLNANLPPDELIKLLTIQNKGGFTPLHEALNSKNPNIVKTYLKQVLNAKLLPDKLVELLTTRTKNRFTPLHEALISGNPNIVKAYLKQVLNAKLPPDKLVELLTAQNNAGFTPLHSALISGNPDIVKAYLKQVVNAKLSSDKLVGLLTAQNNAGFTPLHEALLSGNLDIVTIYLNYVSSARLPNLELVALLTGANRAGFTPLHQALVSGNVDIVTTYLNYVSSAHLSNSKLATLLTAANCSGFTPLHEALLSGNPDVITTYLNYVSSARLSNSKLVTLLTGANRAGFTPFLFACATQKTAHDMDMILEFIKKSLGIEHVAPELDKRTRDGKNFIDNIRNNRKCTDKRELASFFFKKYPINQTIEVNINGFFSGSKKRHRDTIGPDAIDNSPLRKRPRGH